MRFTEGHVSSVRCGCCLPRRGLLAALAGGAAAATLPSAGFAAAPARRAVDVHSHFISPEMQKMTPAGPMSTWTLQRHLDDMERAGVGRAVLSVTTPGVRVADGPGWGLIRGANEYAARLSRDHPDKLGFFTYVRLDDIDRTLAEIAYGFDVLKANGVGLFTSYGDKWLGDPAYDPVFEELNRRKAVVYVHPTTGDCCGGLIPTLPDTLIEFGTDTSRAIASYVYRGAAHRYPDVRMIWSHSGGTMPYLIERFEAQTPPPKDIAPNGFRPVARTFFYDVAQASNPVATGALKQVVGAGQIVFGTDYPFRTPIEHVQALEAGGVFDAAELAGLYRGNVARGLPELIV